MIEQVVEFSTKLELHPFLRQRDVLEQGCVLVVGPRLAERVAGENAIKRSVHRNFVGERRCICQALSTHGIVDLVEREVEKAVGRNRIRNQRAGVREKSGNARPRPFATKVGHARVSDRKWLPGLIAQKSADLPAAEQIAYRGSLDLGNPAGQKLASMEETVPHVEVGGSGSKPG